VKIEGISFAKMDVVIKKRITGIWILSRDNAIGTIIKGNSAFISLVITRILPRM